MSTFNGQIAGMPSASVDRFDGINVRSAVFFLSHCHTDHMVGLAELASADKSTDAAVMYLSAVSAVIVRGLYTELPLRLVPLTVGEPTVVSYTHPQITDDGGEATPPETVEQRLTVTALPAGHCPGSVMFLFEVDATRILYTGDFRLNLTHLQRMSVFRSTPLPIIHIAHIDSTFLSPQYRQFPTQRESSACVADLCDTWLRQHPTNHVWLQTSARFGYEFLFDALWQRLRMPVHVNDAERAAMYRHIPELDACVTTEAQRTRVHACYDGRARNASTDAIPCQTTGGDDTAPIDPRRVRRIRLSAMVWSSWAQGESVHTQIGPQLFRVCYSNHSSWTECRDMLLLLRPQRVELNVLPAGRAERERMRADLAAIVAEYATEPADGVDESADKRGSRTEIAFDLSGIKFGAMPERNVAAEDSDSDCEDSGTVASRSLPKRIKHM